MAVPAHDERDQEFAKQFNLPIREVVRPSGGIRPDTLELTPCFSGDGMSVNSEFISGLMTAEAKTKMIEWLENSKVGVRSVKFKLRDWLFSRQRYWGEPFPIIWKEGVACPLPENELPLLLPELEDFKPNADGQAPLSKAKEWLKTPDGGTREINTMPQWAGSCWYYLRYCDPHNSQYAIDPQVEKYWMGEKAFGNFIKLQKAGGENSASSTRSRAIEVSSLPCSIFRPEFTPFQRAMDIASVARRRV